MAGAGDVSGVDSVRTDSGPDDSDDVGRSETDDLGGAYLSVSAFLLLCQLLQNMTSTKITAIQQMQMIGIPNQFYRMTNLFSAFDISRAKIVKKMNMKHCAYLN